MKFNEIFKGENLKAVGAGVAGGVVTMPVKKFALSKIPVLKDKEMYQDIATVVAGIAIGAFSKGSVLKSFGAGMAVVGGYNLLKNAVTNAGLGETDTFLGEIPDDMPEGDGGVLMGAADGDDFSGDSYDYTSGAAGELNF